MKNQMTAEQIINDIAKTKALETINHFLKTVSGDQFDDLVEVKDMLEYNEITGNEAFNRIIFIIDGVNC